MGAKLHSRALPLLILQRGGEDCTAGKWATALHSNLTHFKEPISTHLGGPPSIPINCRGIQWRIAYIFSLMTEKEKCEAGYIAGLERNVRYSEKKKITGKHCRARRSAELEMEGKVVKRRDKGMTMQNEQERWHRLCYGSWF